MAENNPWALPPKEDSWATTPNNPWALPPEQDLPTQAFPPQQPPQEVPQEPIEPPIQQAPPVYQQPVPQYEAPKKSGMHPALIVLLTVLSVAILGALGWVGYKFYQDRMAAQDDVVVVTTVVVKPPAPASAPAPQPAKKEPVAAPAGSSSCGNSLKYKVFAATSVTSCPFSMATGQAADTQSGSSFGMQVYSPVTQKSYYMGCMDEGGGTLRCEGGDNAVVYLVPH
ncbi:hypothetical protein [Corynebacterium sp. H130]|uniref:hypothetical protein n=1 Tax=Corynebacterium sp. H130 TaxID=3133444 RepID=UPI003094AD43